MPYLGIAITAIGALIFFFPNILWPLQKLRNEMRGIRNTQPTKIFRLIVRLQAAFVIVVGILIVTGIATVQK